MPMQSDPFMEPLFQALAALPGVEAIALGGSRAGSHWDDHSDWDIYLYCTSAVPEPSRRAALQGFCSRMEIGNRFWEEEDNCVLTNGVPIDVLYRSLDGFAQQVAAVVEDFQPCNGYTTCLWHNLLTCRILHDPTGRLHALQARFRVPYPPQLKENILRRSRALLFDALPAYPHQIAKAVERGDQVSILHRTTAFLESYFDLLWALNERTHPGEKRLISLCREQCRLLPNRFEENLQRLFADMSAHPECVAQDVAAILRELDALLAKG